MSSVLNMMNEDSDLFWTLIEKEHLRARSFCRKLMGNRDDGDDLYQDSLVAALGRFGGLRDRSSFRPWLYRIFVNAFKDRIRRPWWKRVTSLTAESAASVPGPNPGPRYAARCRLAIAFRAVSPEEQAIVTLFELEGWTIAELAGLHGTTEPAIKVRLSRARRKMRAALSRFLESSEGKLIVKTLEKEEICVVPKRGEN